MIYLQKGQHIGVSLRKVCVGLGWDPSTDSGEDFDLDVSAFMLNARHKLPRDEYFVFYNNLSSPCGAVSSSGDDLTGGNSDRGDDETLAVDLFMVPGQVQEIIFTVTIHKAEERRQNFGQVHNACIRIYDAVSDEEIARYDLDEDFSIETAIEFGRLCRRNDEWTFEALGIGYKGGLQFFVDKYRS